MVSKKNLDLQDPRSGVVVTAANPKHYNDLRYGQGYTPVDAAPEKPAAKPRRDDEPKSEPVEAPGLEAPTPETEPESQ